MEVDAERLRGLLETVSDAFVALDRQWRYTYVNARAAELLGLQPAALLGRAIGEILPEPLRDALAQGCERALAVGATVEVESYDPALDRWLEGRIHPSSDGVCIFYQDVSERHRQAELLRESEERFRTLADATSEGILIHDEGTIVDVNRALCAMLGYGPEELIGRKGADFVTPASRARLQARIPERSDEPYEGEALCSDGSALPVELRGRTVEYRGRSVRLVRVVDLSERRRAEEALRRQAVLFATMPDGVILHDAEGRIVDWNPGAERLFGYAREEVLGQCPSVLLTAERTAELTHRLMDEVRRHGSWTGEMTLLRKDDTPRICQVMLRALTGEHGDFAGTIGVNRDVTEERVRSQQLRRAERLASLATLVGGVAHELNNPLASIKSFAQLLLLDDRIPSDREALDIMQREADRAAKIVASLRVFADGVQDASAGSQAAVDLNEVVRHVLRVRDYPLQTHNVEVRVELARPLPPVWGDRRLIEQVLLNLVVNAEQALAGHPLPRRLSVRTRSGGTSVVLQVADNGPGIAPEHLGYVFDPFWTTRGPGEGTGLGLSLVHGIVTDHGGEVRVESEPGRGATFTVELPIAVLAGAGVEAPRPAETAPRPLRILVVDDEPAIRTALVRYLRQRGHQVDEAGEGTEALERVGAGDAPAYDVILSDLRMPGMGGEELLTALRARGLGDRVVLMTGDAVSGDTARVLSGADVPTVLKPFDLYSVAEVVERLAQAG